MLQKFKEEREKRKQAAPVSTATSGVAPPSTRPNDRDYRPSKDDHRDRDRDRGYERHSRHEYVSEILIS